MSFEIVKMEKRHLDIIKLELKKFDEFWNTDILTDEFNNENSEYFVMVDENNILGFAGLWFNIDEAHVMNIAVKSEFRRNSYGTRLLEFLINIAKNKNRKCITLEVREDNFPAINLYKKMNFTKEGIRKRYYDNCFDAIIMTKFF